MVVFTIWVRRKRLFADTPTLQGIGGRPRSTVRPGRTINYKVVFGVNDTKDMAVEVNIGADKRIWANS